MVEKALKQYRFYCILNLVWYGLLILGSVTLVLLLRNNQDALTDVPSSTIQYLNSSLIFLAAMSWIFFAATLSVMKPVRTRKWWTGAFVNICIGITTCILTPFCIMLAMKWNSPEVQSYFNPTSTDGDESSKPVV